MKATKSCEQDTKKLPTASIRQTNRGIELHFTLEMQGGIHARPAARIARIAKDFISDIVIIGENGEANAKSVLDLMSLAARNGDQLILICKGQDANLAMEKLASCLIPSFSCNLLHFDMQAPQ